MHSMPACCRAIRAARCSGPGGQVIGVVFSRSTVYQDVGYALTSPGVLTRVQEAERHHSAVSTGPCISG